MLSPALRNLIAPQARVLTIIWFAFLATCPFYGFIAYLITTAAGDAEAPVPALDPQFLTYLFAAIAVVVVAVSFLYQRHAFSAASLERQLAGTIETSADGLAADEQRLVGLFPYYQTSLIVIWAMREAVAIFGLVLTVLRRDALIILPFVAAALVLLAITPPRVMSFMEGAQKLARRAG